MKSTTAWAVVLVDRVIKLSEWLCVFTSKKEALAYNEAVLGNCQGFKIIRVRIIPVKGEGK